MVRTPRGTSRLRLSRGVRPCISSSDLSFAKTGSPLIFATVTSRSLFNGVGLPGGVLPVGLTPSSMTIAIDLRSGVLSS